jgi:hypothetical protein
MNMKSTFRRICTLSIALTLAGLTGCASQMTHQDMTPARVRVANHHAESVSLIALPAPGADAAAAAEFMTELNAALSDSIKASKIFSSVKADGSDYQLTVQFFSESHPAFAIAFTSTLEMGWTLKRVDTGAVVWQESIKSVNTTGGTEAFSGAERSKMAVAGAIKKNISTGLSHLGKLSF